MAYYSEKIEDALLEQADTIRKKIKVIVKKHPDLTAVEYIERATYKMPENLAEILDELNQRVYEMYETDKENNEHLNPSAIEYFDWALEEIVINNN